MYLMSKQADNLTWPLILRILVIITTVSGIVYGYANLESKVNYIAENMEKVIPLIKENEVEIDKHDTDIALIKQFINFK